MTRRKALSGRVETLVGKATGMEPRTDLVRAALEQRAKLYWASTNASTPSHLTARFAPYPLTRGTARRTTRRMVPSIILSPA